MPVLRERCDCSLIGIIRGEGDGEKGGVRRIEDKKEDRGEEGGGRERERDGVKVSTIWVGPNGRRGVSQCSLSNWELTVTWQTTVQLRITPVLMNTNHIVFHIRCAGLLCWPYGGWE